MENTQVVLLNADYSPLGLITWKKAQKLIEKGKVDVVKFTDIVIGVVDKTIKRYLPKVIRLVKMIRQIYKTKVPLNKKNVYTRDGFKCAYCGATGVKLSWDHIIPQSKGGKTTYENLVTACIPCNNKKDNKSCEEVRMYPKVKAYEPTINEFIRIQVRKLGVEKLLKDLGIF
jgi:hypothetical protein